MFSICSPNPFSILHPMLSVLGEWLLWTTQPRFPGLLASNCKLGSVNKKQQQGSLRVPRTTLFLCFGPKMVLVPWCCTTPWYIPLTLSIHCKWSLHDILFHLWWECYLFFIRTLTAREGYLTKPGQIWEDFSKEIMLQLCLHKWED